MIVAIGDLHLPFTDMKAIDGVFEFIQRNKPAVVIQMGDLMDLYSFSHYSKSNKISPHWEIPEARAMGESFWKTIRTMVPKAKCHQLLGNHDARLKKSIATHAPALEAVVDFLNLNSLWEFPGVETHPDWRELVEIDDIVFTHGYGRFGSHMAQFLKSTVCGHLHLGGVTYKNLWGKSIWELNSGFLGDRKALAFNYPPVSLVNWTTGFGVIDELGPRFVAL